MTRATDEKIKLVVPVVKGALPLLDLKEAPGLTMDDFELVTETSTPCELHLWGDILYAVGSNGLILYIK